ncbi:MAG: hypothetical protein WAO74_06775 [Polaribacter sp.]|uniref:POTRA domain-containing protein n=1 Tax=Polaribacter sp. TaxID=1920175 RepID=UPI003BB05FCF
MNQKNKSYFVTYFFLFFLINCFSQDFTLQLSSKFESEKKVLEKIDYIKKHADTISSNLEIKRISEYLKNIGYFTNTIDSVKNIDKVKITFFSLNEKVETAIIRINNKIKFNLKNFRALNDNFTVDIENLTQLLNQLTNHLDKTGKSFSKVQLKNIKIIKSKLFAEIEITESKKRIINKVFIKGYEEFPKAYMKNYFNIKENTIFNKEKITEISKLAKGLSFINEIKPPEVLFTKDSTFIYLYLNKQQNNSFDGIINFASKENGGILFNGNIDLKLNNILNTGESFELFWNSVGNERQEFRISTEIPYIFNSKLSPEISFSLYKQDSSFVNTKFESKINYNFNPKLKLALTYESESSNTLQESVDNSLASFNTNFLGIQLQYKVRKNDLFYNDKFLAQINPTFGKRSSNNNLSNQFKLKTVLSYIVDFNLRNSLYVKNENGLLNSSTYLTNELYRIGGANSLRGFNEQSIFTSNYSSFNIEYRYLTSKKSYLYTITDIGFIKNLDSKSTLTGIGLGYFFKTNNSIVNIAIATNNKAETQQKLESLQLIIRWKNIF